MFKTDKLCWSSGGAAGRWHLLWHNVESSDRGTRAWGSILIRILPMLFIIMSLCYAIQQSVFWVLTFPITLNLIVITLKSSLGVCIIVRSCNTHPCRWLHLQCWVREYNPSPASDITLPCLLSADCLFCLHTNISLGSKSKHIKTQFAPSWIKFIM